MNTKHFTQDKKKETVINDHIAFTAWVKSLQKFNLNNELKTYAFNLPEFTTYENLNISKQVNYFNTACGCKSGGFVMSLTFITILCNFFISGGRFSAINLQQILYGIGITLLGALAGKTAGLLHAHWSLLKLANSLQKKLNSMYTIKQLT